MRVSANVGYVLGGGVGLAGVAAAGSALVGTDRHGTPHQHRTALLAGGSVAAIAGGLTLAAHLPHATTGVLADVLMLSGGMAAGLAIAHLHE